MTGAPSHLPHLRFPRFRWVLLGALVIVLILWIVPALVETISSGEGLEGFARPYLLIFAFVAFDAIIPIFPSESLLTTASTLAGKTTATSRSGSSSSRVRSARSSVTRRSTGCHARSGATSCRRSWNGPRTTRRQRWP